MMVGPAAMEPPWTFELTRSHHAHTRYAPDLTCVYGKKFKV